MAQATLAWIIPVSGGGAGDPHPEHPIFTPPGTPGTPPGAGGSPPYPAHPIWRPDLGIWGGPYFPPYPDQGLPPFPAHPIVMPPPGTGESSPIDPGYFPPGIALPVPPEEGGTPTKAYVVAYVPGYGRQTFLVDLPTPEPPTEATPK